MSDKVVIFLNCTKIGAFQEKNLNYNRYEINTYLGE
jgi:hypothetical protein